MKTLEEIQNRLSLGEFDFSRHALKRVVERNIRAKKEYVNEIFQIDNKRILVEHIPAVVCVRCGEETFSRETTERIRQMVHGEAKPARSISMDVFTFA
ncbi:MAG: YgiT-type zinc finger protein [Planctomycetes bacterium]|nr:YgiT-type zinc finger protein [Planctomycetota bacterium]